MEKEFLQKVNLGLLQKELNMDIPAIAKLVNVGEQVVYRWAWDKDKNGNRPKYNALKILLENGATTESLFGVKPKLAKEPLSSEDFMAGVKKALSDLGKV